MVNYIFLGVIAFLLAFLAFILFMFREDKEQGMGEWATDGISAFIKGCTEKVNLWRECKHGGYN